MQDDDKSCAGRCISPTIPIGYGRAEEARSDKSPTPSSHANDTVLHAKIEKAEKFQEIMKTANAIIRKKTTNEQKIEQLQAAGLGDLNAHKLLEPDFAGKIGFPAYMLQNNNANIRRMKQRIQQIETTRATPAARVDFEAAMPRRTPTLTACKCSSTRSRPPTYGQSSRPMASTGRAGWALGSDNPARTPRLRWNEPWA